VIQGAVSAWLATLVAGTVALATATALPRWVKISIGVDGIVLDEEDVGLWQKCRPDASNYNCSMLRLWSTTGQRLAFVLALDFEVQCHRWMTRRAPTVS